MASIDVIWSIIKNSNAFLLKRNRQTFSMESNNLKGVNSKRFSGLCQRKTIGVEAAEGGKGVVLVTKKRTGTNHPDKIYHRVVLKRDSRRTFRAIRKVAFTNRYRKDLCNAAVRRAAAILKSQRVSVQKKGTGTNKE